MYKKFKGWISSIWEWGYGCPYRLQRLIMILGVVIRMCVSLLLAMCLFKTYPCQGISMHKLAPYELHQHALHMAAYRQSNLRKAGYFYLPLIFTHIRYEADAIVYNPEFRHGVVIQFKTMHKDKTDYKEIAQWLHEYGANTQLLSYMICNSSGYEVMSSKTMPLLNSLYKRELINMVLLAYPYNAHLHLNTPQGALLQQGVAFYSDIMPPARYNELTQSNYLSTLSYA